MSMFSSLTGIGINPFGKNKLKINGMKALGTMATLGSMGALGPVAGAMRAIPGASAIGSGISKLGGVSKVASGLGGMLGKAGGLVDPLLGAGALYEGYKDNQKSTDYRNRALAVAENGYAERAPLRTAGVSGMMNETRPDLSSIYANGNPYSKVQRRTVA